jgi:DNA-directed RNA polymerase subunit RPC12/RpoP
MDYRCPDCGAHLGKRKLTQAIVARMEVDCSNCRSTIRLNVHPSEAILVVLSFGAIIALGALAYGLQSEPLALATFGAVMLGALALPVLEHTYLRTWPRYASRVQGPKGGYSPPRS